MLIQLSDSYIATDILIPFLKENSIEYSIIHLKTEPHIKKNELNQECSDIRVLKENDYLERKIVEGLISSGISLKHHGFFMLTSCILETCKQNGFCLLTKDIYPVVAKEYKTSAKNVDSCVRVAINHGWKIQEELLHDGDTVDNFFNSIKHKPSNKAFIMNAYRILMTSMK